METEKKKQLLADFIAEKDLSDLKSGFESLLNISTDPQLADLYGGFGKNEIRGIDFLVRALRIIDQGIN